MSKQGRVYVILAGLWAASIAAVGVAAQERAQAPMFQPLAEPKVIFGQDVDFRVDGMLGNVPAGVVVIKVNDRWVEANIGGYYLAPKRTDRP